MTGDDYRAARLRLGLTQAELASRLGVTATSVARRERGEQRITPEAALALRAVELLNRPARHRRRPARRHRAPGG